MTSMLLTASASLRILFQSSIETEFDEHLTGHGVQLARRAPETSSDSDCFASPGDRDRYDPTEPVKRAIEGFEPSNGSESPPVGENRFRRPGR